MKAVITVGDGTVRLVDVPQPTLELPDDAIVQVTAAAICGTDLHFVKDPVVPATTTLGHEFIGIVREVGDGVRHLAPGDRVLSKMFVACGRCKACRTANQPRCSEYQLFGGGALSGGQAEFVRVPRADFTLSPIGDEVRDADALAMTDILPTAWEALERVSMSGGDTLTIVGGGPVGLLTAQLALARGASQVYVVDLDDKRLARVAGIGAVPIDGRNGAAQRILELTGGIGTNAAIDAAGSAPALATALGSVALGGAVGLVGVLLGGPIPIDAVSIFRRQVDVVPITGNPYASNDALSAMIVSQRIAPGDVFDHEAPLAKAEETYASFIARDFVKAILRP
jgi:alcohol dehydrogenase